MARVTLTVTTIDGATPANSLQSVDSKDIVGMTSSDNLTTGTAVLTVLHYEGLPQGARAVKQKWVTTQSYAAVQAAVNAADAEAGAQLTSEKDASGGYVGLTLFKHNFLNVLGTFISFFTNSNTAARTYTFQDRNGTIADDTDLGLKISSTAKDATGGVAGLTLFKVNLKNDANTFTSTLANTNTAARAYTLPDVAGGILVGAKIATGALVGGVRTVTVTGASTSSTAVVMTVALGGTVAAGGYKVACTADTVTITALQADGTTTENGCTSTVQGICIL